MHPPALSTNIFAHLPIDWVIIVVFALIVSFDALRSGAGRASVLALSFPIAAFLSDLLPSTYLIGSIVASLSTPVLKAVLFFVLFAIVYLLAYRIVYTFGSLSRGLLFSLLAGMSATIVTIVMWLQVPALSALWHFGTQVQTIFGGSYALIWILGAFVVLAFVRS